MAAVAPRSGSVRLLWIAAIGNVVATTWGNVASVLGLSGDLLAVPNAMPGIGWAIVSIADLALFVVAGFALHRDARLEPDDARHGRLRRVYWALFALGIVGIASRYWGIWLFLFGVRLICLG